MVLYNQNNNASLREFYFDIDTDIIRPNKTTMRKHCHNRFEIYFITKGNSCYFIENNVYHLIPDSFKSPVRQLPNRASLR